MKVLIFGISCVGKTTVGTLLAKKMNFKFYDLDQVNKDTYGSIDEFQRVFPFAYDRAMKQADTLYNIIMEDDEDAVIAVTPINYSDGINQLFKLKDVVPFELLDTVDNIFDRVAFYDENDVIMEDSDEYKLKYASVYRREVEEDLKYYGKVYEKVKNKVFLNGKSAEEGADILYGFIEKIKRKKKK